jgi:hypothetical protein
MKSAKRKLLAGVLVLLCILVWAVILNSMNNWFSVRWLRYQVTKNADPIELQQWATSLLAKHGGELSGYQDFYGTNMPSGLRKVQAGYPNVRIWERREVWVFGDRKGSPFLVISPTSPTPTNQNIFPWQDGIYFVR